MKHGSGLSVGVKTAWPRRYIRTSEMYRWAGITDHFKWCQYGLCL